MDEEGRTPLMLAAGRGDLEAERSLLAQGAEVNAADARGFSALFHACYNGDEDRGYPEVVRALLEAGAEEARIGYGVRPLMDGFIELFDPNREFPSPLSQVKYDFLS